MSIFNSKLFIPHSNLHSLRNEQGTKHTEILLLHKSEGKNFTHENSAEKFSNREKQFTAKTADPTRATRLFLESQMNVNKIARRSDEENLRSCEGK